MELKRGESVAFLIFVFFFSLGKSQVVTPPPCDVAQDFSPSFVVCKDGKVIRFNDKTVPPSLDPATATNVQSKDVVYSDQIKQSARLFLPVQVTTQQGKKLPVIIYYHGGGFCVSSFASPEYNNMTVGFSSGSNALVVSFNYRLAPESLLPAAFDDAWTAMQWLASHVNGDGPESWLNLYADFNKVILMGDSAGATLAVNVALRHGQHKLEGINFIGMLLQMPFFFDFTDTNGHPWTSKTKYIYPAAVGTNNLLLNPANDPNLSMLGVPQVVFVVGEKDLLIGIQKQFLETLMNTTWQGKAEIKEVIGVGHMFNLNPPNPGNATKAKELMDDMNRYVVEWVA